MTLGLSLSAFTTLHDLALNGSEPSFEVAKLAVLALFVVMRSFAIRRFRPA